MDTAKRSRHSKKDSVASSIAGGLFVAGGPSRLPTVPEHEISGSLAQSMNGLALAEARRGLESGHSHSKHGSSKHTSGHSSKHGSSKHTSGHSSKHGSSKHTSGHSHSKHSSTRALVPAPSRQPGTVVSMNTAGRHNLSDETVFYRSELETPFASGEFRWVAQGIYEGGPRDGQGCVAKWFKSGHVFSETFFDMDIFAVDKALSFVEKFNEAQIIDKPIRLNIPTVAMCYSVEGPDKLWEGRHFLIEPMIDNYEKVNSNSGWSDESHSWGSVMQALSHFSYHVSGGRYVLCDLQGGRYQSSIIITDPVILSRNREFGVTDLGQQGIDNFFSLHECNKYCRKEWAMPFPTVQTITSSSKTTFMGFPLSVSTNHSRAPGSVYGF
ncbi:hypothetical protein G6O67_007784 [Ophiocordyceps sinensis]|uniref:Alpha-type protein kinase domain-containing protein n=2 Tax=Ophiocordyceps sinensis TaxID=72228 RepID=A0A8H4LVV7_9HYPO|nr:Protein kinase-like domain protein [Ophiocordyceps sinensis CO18]KAF4505881.1 hypothetical protein G6O67_007784 [Ophiocordyceps sinensis]